MNIYDLFEGKAKKQRLDAKCWTGYHKAGTKVKGDTRVNNCVPNESTVNEFAPPGGDDGGPDEDEILFRLAKQWWLGTEQDMARAERTLASMGWEIGEDEGSYDDGGVFVVRAGDENGRSYQSWPHEELVAEGVAEDTDKYAELSKKIQDLAQAGKEGEANKLRYELNRLLMLDRDKKRRQERSVAEGNNPWGPEGRYVGDTGPAQITTTVAKHEFKPGDRVVYTPTGQHAKIEDLNKDRTTARIHVASAMGGKYFNCKVSDLKAMGSLREKSTSQAQFRTMAAAAHNPEFAKKVGIKQSVAREFHGADKKQSYKSLPKKVDEGIMDFMQPQQPKTAKDKLTLAAMRQIEKARADKERQDPTYVRSVDLPKNPDHVRVVTDAKGDYVPPKEADYGDDYQAMVRRVAAQEKRKQQPKPKREDSNMPVAVDSTSPIHGTNEDSEDGDGISTKNVSPASQKLIQKARQAAPDARSDLDAVFAYLDDVAKRTQDNYGRVNDILQQLDPLSSDLDHAEQELNKVRQVNQGQQQLLGRLKARLDKGSEDNAPAQAQQATQDKKDADDRNTISQQLDQEPKQVVVKQEPQQQKPQGPVDAVDTYARREVEKLNARDLTRTARDQIRHNAASTMLQKADGIGSDPNLATAFNPDKIRALAKNLPKDEISEDIYESRLYKMKLAGYFD